MIAVARGPPGAGRVDWLACGSPGHGSPGSCRQTRSRATYQEQGPSRSRRTQSGDTPCPTTVNVRDAEHHVPCVIVNHCHDVVNVTVRRGRGAGRVQRQRIGFSAVRALQPHACRDTAPSGLSRPLRRRDPLPRGSCPGSPAVSVVVADQVPDKLVTSPRRNP